MAWTALGADGYSYLCVVNSDGTNPHTIFYGNTGYLSNLFQSTSWRHDGQKIMFNYVYDDNQGNDYYTNCTVNEDGSNFWYDGNFPDCQFSDWSHYDANIRAMTQSGWPPDFNSYLRWRRLDGAQGSIWLSTSGVVAAFSYCAWYDASTIYMVLKRGDLIGYPNREVVLWVTSSNHDVVVTSDLNCYLHGLSFSPDRVYMVVSEYNGSTMTIYKRNLNTGVTSNLGGGAWPNWRQSEDGCAEEAGALLSSVPRIVPNPLADFGMVSYHCQSGGPVRLVLCDAGGRDVRTIVNRVESPGWHTAELDASGLANGVYFVKSTAGGSCQTHKVVVQR